jgi:hypothetical protein
VPADAPAGWNAAGAPRWQQRALYDSLKDITAQSLDNIRLARSATVDLVGTTQLGDALAGSAKIDPDGLYELVLKRSTPGA